MNAFKLYCEPEFNFRSLFCWLMETEKTTNGATHHESNSKEKKSVNEAKESIDKAKESNGEAKENIETAKTHHTFHKYLTALRPWSFTASLTPVLIGAALSYRMQSQVNIIVLAVVSITALAVHAAGNLVNTIYDYKRGVDTKKSDDRTLVDEQLSVNNLVTLGTVCYGVGCTGLFVLCLISPAQVQHLSLMYFCGLSGSFLYTGGLGLKYIALGDIVIFLTFGPLTVMFAYLAITGDFGVPTILYATPLALNIECVLHANNCRDRIADREAGIVTLAILLGPTLSYILFCILLFGPYVAFGYVTMHCSKWFLLPTLTVMLAFSIERKFRSGNLQNMPQEVAKLNFMLGIAFVISIILTPKENLPFNEFF